MPTSKCLRDFIACWSSPCQLEGTYASESVLKEDTDESHGICEEKNIDLNEDTRVTGVSCGDPWLGECMQNSDGVGQRELR